MLQNIIIADDFIISTYNIMWGLALICGFIYLEKEFESNAINYNSRKNIKLYIIIALLFAVIGARLFDYFVHRGEIESLFAAGFTFYGGLLFGGVILVVLLASSDLLIFKTLNLLIPSLVIGHALGRVGCFLGGCCYGKPTASPLGVIFPENSLASLEYGVGTAVHPTQLYEALFLFILFFILIKTISFKKRIAIYLISYSIFRFIVENFRGDDRGVFIKTLNLSPSQVVSIFLLLL